MNINKVAFIDRDGVINIDYGYVHSWNEFKICEGVIEGLKNLIDLDFKIIIITNQSGIARGLFSENEYQKLTIQMKNFFKVNGIQITDIFHCPHHPDFSKGTLSNCNCRKPKPGLFFKALEKYNISIEKSIAIGDNERDMIAAKLAGIERRYLISNKNKVNADETCALKIFNSLLYCSKFLKNKFKDF